MGIDVRILYAFCAIWGIAEIFIARWMFKAKPEENIMRKYPKGVRFYSQLPFGKSWTRRVAKSDVQVFEKYQYRINIWYLSVIIPFFAIMLFLSVMPIAGLHFK
jgi:hypothetical protein